MTTDREVDEMVARCVGIMVFYRNSGKTAQSTGQMAAEVRAAAGCVKEWHAADRVVGRIRAAVKAELVARYGYELAVRLDGEFSKAFECEALPMPVPSPSMARP